MVSGQTTLYQNDSDPPADGAVNVCATELSPLVGTVDPTIAALPVWPLDETEVVPLEVQPVRPDSKPPLVIPLPPAAVTVSETVVLCVADVPVPVTVTLYVP